jgi:hypothetical protein
MKHSVLILILFVLQFGKSASAQSFEGVKNSSCHDENNVYYISNAGKTYEVNGYKIVNGKEDFMGTLVFTYDEKQNAYVSVDKEHGVTWEFKIADNTMKGTLVVKGNVHRIVELKKEN